MNEINQASLRPADAAKYLGVSLRQLYNLSEQPGFPRKIYLSARCVAYRRESLDEWLKQRELQSKKAS